MSQITGISSMTNVSLLFTGTDVNPDALDWTNVAVSGSIYGQTNTQTFTGINTAINVSFALTNTGGTDIFTSVSYSKNGGAFTSIASGATLSISNNDTLAWQLTNNDPSNNPILGSFRVRNASNANTELDRFSYNINPISGGGEV